MEKSWLKDALSAGVSANAVKSGTVLTQGWFWVRVKGCCILYRGTSAEKINFDSIVAVCNWDASQIRATGVEHDVGRSYFYLLRRVSGCGDTEGTLGSAVKVEIGGAGELLPGKPNTIRDVRAFQGDGGKVVLEWYYCPLMQGSKMQRFAIYGDGGEGQISYESPLATVGYRGQRFYRYQSNSLAVGTYLFAIVALGFRGSRDSALSQIRVDVAAAKPKPVLVISTQIQ